MESYPKTMSGRCKCRERRASGAVVTFICSLLLAGADAVAEPPQPPVARLPVLTTARQAHSLTFSQAALAYPVHLRGVVTFYDPYQEGQKALFVADPTGASSLQPDRKPFPRSMPVPSSMSPA
jgi:hypothetical protein